MGTDFLIIGAGIGGTVLAELLGRGGKKVLVLEKSSRPPSWTRPEILWPATTDILFGLIPQATWEQDSMLPLRGIDFFNGERFVPGITPEVLRRADVQPWATDPNLTREQLMRLSSFELRRGVAVTQVLMEKERVVGVRARNIATGREEELLAPWVVGDDGVNSVVRQGCGIELRTRLFPLDFLCFSFDWPKTFPHGTARVWQNFRQLNSGIAVLGAIPLPMNKGAGVILVRNSTLQTPARAAEAWKQFSALDPAINEVMGAREFPTGLAHIRRPWGHASKYGKPGVVLLGDAAHPVSPAGGQGANMSVADARLLATLILAGDPDFLQTYERRRRPANERSLRLTRGTVFLFGLPGWLYSSSLLVKSVGAVSRYPGLLARAIRSTSRAFLENPQQSRGS